MQEMSSFCPSSVLSRVRVVCLPVSCSVWGHEDRIERTRVPPFHVGNGPHRFLAGFAVRIPDSLLERKLIQRAQKRGTEERFWHGGHPREGDLVPSASAFLVSGEKDDFDGGEGPTARVLQLLRRESDTDYYYFYVQSSHDFL